MLKFQAFFYQADLWNTVITKDELCSFCQNCAVAIPKTHIRPTKAGLNWLSSWFYDVGLDQIWHNDNKYNLSLFFQSLIPKEIPKCIFPLIFCWSWQSQNAPLATCFNVKQIKSNGLWLRIKARQKQTPWWGNDPLSRKKWSECGPLSSVAGGLPGQC